jgi:hypothetical protein
MLAKETYYKGKRDLLKGQKRPNQEAEETYYTGKRQTWAEMAKHTRRRLGQTLPLCKCGKCGSQMLPLGQMLPLCGICHMVAVAPTEDLGG